MTPLIEAFLAQAEACRNLDSEFNWRLCNLLANRLDTSTKVGQTLFDWPVDPHFRAEAVPLRVTGALHAIVLQGLDTDLVNNYPPNTTSDDALWAAIQKAFETHEAFILETIKSAPQTNEIRRCSGLIPAFHLIAKETDFPLMMSEIGASAGLNLDWDNYAVRINDSYWGDPNAEVIFTPDWTGPLPPKANVNILDRQGCDLNPLVPTNENDKQRLLSYIWADQEQRMTNTKRALDLAAKANHTVHKMDALEFLEKRLSEPKENTTHVIYHSIVWQYLPAEAKVKGQEIIEAAGARATKNSPLAWLQFEGDGKLGGAAITLRTWPENRTRVLGRADYHGRWIKWTG